MFGFDGYARTAAPIAINAKISDPVYVGNANSVTFELPTFAASVITTTANVYALVANTSTGTYQRVTIEGVYSAGSGIREWELPSSVGGKMVVVPWMGNFSYVKLELSNTATAAYTPYIHVKQ